MKCYSVLKYTKKINQKKKLLYDCVVGVNWVQKEFERGFSCMEMKHWCLSFQIIINIFVLFLLRRRLLETRNGKSFFIFSYCCLIDSRSNYKIVIHQSMIYLRLFQFTSFLTVHDSFTFLECSVENGSTYHTILMIMKKSTKWDCRFRQLYLELINSKSTTLDI